MAWFLGCWLVFGVTVSAFWFRVEGMPRVREGSSTIQVELRNAILGGFFGVVFFICYAIAVNLAQLLGWKRAQDFLQRIK